MNFTFKKKIGDTEFEFQESAADIKEFFRKVSFISELPSVGPNGETDLVVMHRTTKTGDEYFSLVSKEADQEFKLGQHKNAPTLFSKGWEALYKPENEGQAQTSGGLGNQQNYQQNAPAGNQQQAPVNTGLGNQNLGNQQNAQAAPQPQANTSAPAASPSNNQNNQAYQEVLGKYGLGGNQ